MAKSVCGLLLVVVASGLSGCASSGGSDESYLSHVMDLAHPWHAAPAFAGGMVTAAIGCPIVLVCARGEDFWEKELCLALLGGAVFGFPFYALLYPLEWVFPAGNEASADRPPESAPPGAEPERSGDPPCLDRPARNPGGALEGAE